MSSGGLVGAGLGAFQGSMDIGSAFAAGEDIRAQTGYTTSQLELKEEALKMGAADARARGIDKRVMIQEQLKQELSSRRAKVGNSGVVIGSGSAGHVETSQRVVASLDELEAMNQAEREAFSFEFEAAQAASDRAFASHAGKVARRNTIIAGGMQALGRVGGGFVKGGGLKGTGAGNEATTGAAGAFNANLQNMPGDSLLPANSNPRRAGGSMDKDKASARNRGRLFSNTQRGVDRLLETSSQRRRRRNRRIRQDF